jgi:hypothetical protein
MRKHIVLPTPANLRFYRRLIGLGLVMALISLVVALIVIGMGRGGGPGRSPYSLMLYGLGLVVALVAWRGTASRLDQQIRQLASYGRRYTVDRITTDMMQRGWINGSHVVVAQWRDANGATHEALSEGFDYNPWPLLQRERVQVVADPFHLDLCLVAGDTLPPRRYCALDRGQRAEVARISPLHPALMSIPVWIPILLVLAVLTYLATRLAILS